MPTPPTYADVEKAAERIEGQAHRTPVLTSRRVDAEVGARLYFKCENLQRMGAFKFRGAFNALSRFDPDQRRAGVVAFSSGNHAQAVALSAGILGIPATILMPRDAPPAKLAATRGYGAEVVEFDRYTEDREALARAVADGRGATLLPPYDHPDIIAGQGTATRELFTEVGELDALFVPLGGGGLLAGATLAARALSPTCRVYGVEPEAGDDVRQSLEKGSIVHIPAPRTIADGAQTQHVGVLPFEILRGGPGVGVDAVLTATDDELVAAMRVFAATMKMVVEPTGCLGFAAARRTAAELAGQRVGVVVSGGNVDIARYAALLGDS
ncbi:threo-3-hydroxy-L-aspartate ammonia-lyase [Pseudonocardia humida]|uniref:Threo-3-hydroxy-L-aspartate ammonia-lyase n=1 Tax=Pseudonocardia humida TaxID=2800819 RepID=A0ABT1ADT3_9PSEU|nr:threo-3-hydroxy-L-aspartate ammonia-lyase [Pseudonocardia humida]MCO1661070.1 threo-3-hydroxy-L-aspartate ammonia-lyase [Pseudonocardia humida]